MSTVTSLGAAISSSSRSPERIGGSSLWASDVRPRRTTARIAGEVTDIALGAFSAVTVDCEHHAEGDPAINDGGPGAFDLGVVHPETLSPLGERVEQHPPWVHADDVSGAEPEAGGAGAHTDVERLAANASRAARSEVCRPGAGPLRRRHR
jgi:hypothetical protein